MMRKMIAVLSGVSAIGFAVALANTNPNGDTQSQTSSNSTTTTTTKTCTDDNGVTYYRGHTGFEDCMVQMNNAASSQMAGTIDNSANPKTNQGTDSTSSSTTTTTTKSATDAD